MPRTGRSRGAVPIGNPAPPAAVGATLRVRAINQAHVRREWDPAPGAAAYYLVTSVDACGN